MSGSDGVVPCNAICVPSARQRKGRVGKPLAVGEGMNSATAHETQSSGPRTLQSKFPTTRILVSMVPTRQLNRFVIIG